MDKKIILAVAGAGKTYYICNNVDEKKRNLIIAYTNRNVNNIEKELINNKKNNKYTKIFTFHKFLYNFFIRPYEISIGELFKCTIKSNGLILDEAQKPFDSNGNYNNKYRNKKTINHYMINDRYYSSNIAELILYLKDNSDIFDRAVNNLNRFFDYIFVDEFQDFREENYKVLEEIIKKCNNITLVGDYFQHSVNGKTKSGIPFERKKFNVSKRKYETQEISYNEFKEMLKKLSIIIDDKTLKKSRRCSEDICNYVSEKLKIDIESQKINKGNVIIINDVDKATELLEDNNIKKLMYNAPYKWNFNADSWSYCKGDTYNDICVILTSNLNKLPSNDFSIKGISQKTINMLYVAMTRTKKDLYIISNDIFKKISDDYKKI